MSKKTEYRAAENEYFHIYNRGVANRLIFDSRDNYDFFLVKVNHAFNPSEIKIICFCLMPNHFHFVIQQLVHDGISRFMGLVCNGYAKALNNQRGSTGHVFESKYKIKHINSENYLLWLSRYVHRNPKEACLVQRCVDWGYSSLHDLLAEKRHSFVDAEVILSQFASVAEYVRYVEDDAFEAPTGAFKCLFTE
jgi:putative transposase